MWKCPSSIWSGIRTQDFRNMRAPAMKVMVVVPLIRFRFCVWLNKTLYLGARYGKLFWGLEGVLSVTKSFVEIIGRAKRNALFGFILIYLLTERRESNPVRFTVTIANFTTVRLCAMVKWSACLTSAPIIRVQIPLNSTVFSVISCVLK